MSVTFIAGTGTDIGKTYVTALLARQLRAAGRRVLALKPVASGVPAVSDAAFAESDTAQLLDAQGLRRTQENIAACSPWRFKAPLSPDMAASAEDQTLEAAALVAWCRERIAAAPAGTVVLIEGVGGVMSPVASDATNLDWIEALGCRTVLVTGTYLGALTHTLTACVAMKARGAALVALVLNETAASTVNFEATRRTLGRFLPDPAITPLRQGDRHLDIHLG